MAFTGKSTFDTYQYPNEFFLSRMASIQDPWKKYLDIIPMSDFPLGTNKDTYYEDRFMYFSDALAADYTAASDTTVTVSDGTKFRVGDIIQFGTTNVTYAVSAISTNTLTIGSAAHYGTKTNASNGDVVTIVSRSELSGEDANVAARDMTAQPYERTCHTALIKQTILISKDAMTDATKYGVSGDARKAMEESKAMKAVVKNLAYSSMMGYFKTTESSSVRGYMDGILPTLLTANSISGGSGGADTYIAAFTTHQAAGAEGCTHALCSPDMYSDLVNAFDAQNYAPPGSPIGMSFPAADTVFGRVILISDPRIRSANTMLLLNMNLIEMANKQGMAFQLEELAKTGDHYKAQIVGRYGQRIYGRDDQHAFVSFS